LEPCAEKRILPEDLKTVSLVKAWAIRAAFEETTERLREAEDRLVKVSLGAALKIVASTYNINSALSKTARSAPSTLILNGE